MVSQTPPEPRALSDEALNAKVAELQAGPDGLMAAMAFIEEQNRLRQEDAFAYSQWQLQIEMERATAPYKPEPTPSASEQAPSAADQLQDIFSPQPAFSESVVSEPVAVDVPFVDEPVSENVAPEPAPVAPPAEPEIDIFASVSEPVAVEPEQAFSSPEPSAPVENIEDVVAALNASYAQVATEPEEFEPAPIAESVEKLVDGPSLDEFPAPLQSNLLIESDAEVEIEIEQSTETVVVTEVVPLTKSAAALSWSWLAIASTPLVFVFAAFLKESGASLAQSVVILGSVLLISSVLAGVGAVAAKRGSSSLSFVSRAAFGVWGNYLPGILMFAVRIFWAVALLFIAARIITPLIFNQPWFASVSERLIFPAEFTAMIFVVGPVLFAAALVAGFGGVTMLRSMQVTAVISLIGIAAISYFVLMNYSIQDLEQGELIAPVSLIDLGILSFAIVGLILFAQSGDFARKLDPETPGAKVFFLSFVSSFFLPLIVGILGLSWLHMAGDTLGTVFTEETLATVASAAPIWVFVLFAVSLGISLLQLIAQSLYSLSGSLSGLGSTLRGGVAVAILTVLVLVAVLSAAYLVSVSRLFDWLLELVLLSAVVAASWAGIFIADALARSRGYHEVSLTREYGFYGRMNIANSFGFVGALALGFGYLNGSGELSFWAGYLGDLTPGIFEMAGSYIGIAMAFGLALLFPVVFGIPKIKKQEQNLLELDQRRQELKEFLDAAQ